MMLLRRCFFTGGQVDLALGCVGSCLLFYTFCALRKDFLLSWVDQQDGRLVLPWLMNVFCFTTKDTARRSRNKRLLVALVTVLFVSETAD